MRDRVVLTPEAAGIKKSAWGVVPLLLADLARREHRHLKTQPMLPLKSNHKDAYTHHHGPQAGHPRPMARKGDWLCPEPDRSLWRFRWSPDREGGTCPQARNEKLKNVRGDHIDQGGVGVPSPTSPFGPGRGARGPGGGAGGQGRRWLVPHGRRWGRWRWRGGGPSLAGQGGRPEGTGGGGL